MLFDIVPDNFFSPLASPGKVAYWECLCRIFSVTNGQLSFGVERDVLVDELQFYFESSMAAQVSEEGLQEEDVRRMSSRDKANFVLRRLEYYGWISVETDYNYVQRVNFMDYAVRIMKTLLDISEEKKTEYQGYIYTIYSLARSGNENPAVALMQIVDNTDALLTGLKTLNANIRHYIDDLTKHSTVSEILDALLNDYYSNVVDKAYHRLLTSDNVSKFRPEIIERLQADSRSSKYLSKASDELASMREITPEEAREQVLEMLHEVIEAFQNMDEILDEINQKNTRYQRAAINRARFLLSSSDDVRGQVKDILTALGEKITEEKLDCSSVYELEETDQLIRIFSWEYLDTDSLYSPLEGRKEFRPEEINETEADEEIRRQKRLRMEQHLEQVLSPQKIDRYVDEMLGQRDQMAASELPVGEGDTFIRLIYIRLYGQRKNMHYEVRPEHMTQKDGFRFRDFIITRK